MTYESLMDARFRASLEAENDEQAEVSERLKKTTCILVFLTDGAHKDDYIKQLQGMDLLVGYYIKKDRLLDKPFMENLFIKSYRAFYRKLKK